MSTPWMPLYIADYLADTSHLSTLEHGAYLLLIMAYWRRGGLPDDDIKLARITGLSVDDWFNVRSTVVQMFHDGWKHKRIDEELQRAEEKSKQASEAGKRSAEARKRASVERPLNVRCNETPTESQLSQPQPQLEEKQEKNSVPNGTAEQAQRDEPKKIVRLVAKDPDPDRSLFDRGKELLGKSSGGQIAKLKALYGGDVAEARKSLEAAAQKSNPAEYIAAIIGRHSRAPPEQQSLYNTIL